MARKAKFNVAEMGPVQAWTQFNQAKEVGAEQNRIVKAIREHYTPMVLKAGRAIVLFTDEDGLDHGFEVNLTANFKKTEFERRLLAKFGKKMTDEIMDEFNASKTGESKTFKAF